MLIALILQVQILLVYCVGRGVCEGEVFAWYLSNLVWYLQVPPKASLYMAFRVGGRSHSF